MTLSQEKIVELKTKLEAEKTSLTETLSSLGRIIDGKNDWMATPAEQPGPTGNDDPDKNVQADYVEEFEARVSESNVIEQQYAEIVSALDKIENGNYGICEVCSGLIEEDRLEANPSARTCKKHME